MGSTVLNLVQTFADKLGLPTPNAFIGATDKSTKQYRALFRETMADLSEYRWQQQKYPASFLSVAGSLQGDLSSLRLFGSGYGGIIKDSMWNATRHMMIFGPVSEQSWSALQSLPASGPEFQSYIFQNKLYITPDQVDGETIRAVIWSRYLVQASGGVGYKEFITNDGDTLLIPDNTVLRLFEAKWRKQKGEPGWEDTYNDAMGLIAKNIVNDGPTILSMESSPRVGARPGIIIPPGSWPVSP